MPALGMVLASRAGKMCWRAAFCFALRQSQRISLEPQRLWRLFGEEVAAQKERGRKTLGFFERNAPRSV